MLTIEERVASLKTTTDRMEAVKTIGLFMAELMYRQRRFAKVAG